MPRRPRSIVLCLVLQASAAAGQQPVDGAGGSNPGASPPPTARRVRVTDYHRPPPREFPVDAATPTRTVTHEEEQRIHPEIDDSVRLGPTHDGAGLATAAAVFGLGAALTLKLTRSGAARTASARSPKPSRAPGPAHHPAVEVRRVSVAFDWTARASIQHRLAQASATIDPRTPHGLHAAAAHARDALASAHRAARYGAFQTWSLDPARGQAVFDQVAASLRGRRPAEAVDHARRAAAPQPFPRPAEGPGLVVVTLLVTSNGPLPPLPTTLSLPALMAALDGIIPARPDLLAALELVWSPADEGDPLSSAELAALYPELLPLDAEAAPGRRACGSCRAVYAGELGRCPACGGV